MLLDAEIPKPAKFAKGGRGLRDKRPKNMFKIITDELDSDRKDDEVSSHLSFITFEFV